MKIERAPFMPVTPDIDDDRLEQLATAKGVGALVKPELARSSEGEGPTPPRRIATPAARGPAAPPPPTQPAAEEATPRSRMKTVNLELPDYVWTDLKIRAAHEQVSVRHLIMIALKGQGFVIREPDMVEDGRRVRGGRAD